MNSLIKLDNTITRLRSLEYQKSWGEFSYKRGKWISNKASWRVADFRWKNKIRNPRIPNSVIPYRHLGKLKKNDYIKRLASKNIPWKLFKDMFLNTNNRKKWQPNQSQLFSRRSDKSKTENLPWIWRDLASPMWRLIALVYAKKLSVRSLIYIVNHGGWNRYYSSPRYRRFNGSYKRTLIYLDTLRIYVPQIEFHVLRQKLWNFIGSVKNKKKNVMYKLFKKKNYE